MESVNQAGKWCSKNGSALFARKRVTSALEGVAEKVFQHETIGSNLSHRATTRKSQSTTPA
jgi:hypothetical protein